MFRILNYRCKFSALRILELNIFFCNDGFLPFKQAVKLGSHIFLIKLFQINLVGLEDLPRLKNKMPQARDIFKA